MITESRVWKSGGILEGIRVRTHSDVCDFSRWSEAGGDTARVVTSSEGPVSAYSRLPCFDNSDNLQLCNLTNPAPEPFLVRNHKSQRTSRCVQWFAVSTVSQQYLPVIE